MHSLFLRVFVSFWLLIGLIIGAAAVSGFLYAERLQATIEDFEVGDSMTEASAILANGGRAALGEWLTGLPRDDGVLVYIVDERGRDINGRRLPFAMRRYLDRHHFRADAGDGAESTARSSRRSRRLPQLTTPDGDRLTMLVAPVRSPEAFWSSSDLRVQLFLIAVLTSGLLSYALAAAVSRPVRNLREAAVAYADGDLAVRVPASVTSRRDELGMLGRDFDTMAEKLGRAYQQQTELTRNISHELRSPLARMRVALELARRKAGNLSEFDRLDTDAERLDSLIGQIMRYTKLDSDQPTDDTEFDLADVISEVVENANFEQKGQKQVRFFNAASRPLTVTGRRGALISAFENVVRNAVRHAPADGNVAIRAETEDDKVSVSIADGGPGVAEDELPRLFEPFFRTRESLESGDMSGTGLGLAIARRAIEAHDGDIVAHNNGGLVVTITLPLAEPHPPERSASERE